MQERRLEKTKTPGIYRRGSRYVVRYRDARGNQHQAAAATLAEARQIRAERVSSVGKRERQPGKPQRFDEYARAWIDNTTGRTAHGLRAATRRDYRRALELYAIPFFEGTLLSEIGPAMLKEFARDLTQKDLKPNTVRAMIAPVKSLLAEAHEDELIVSNPAAGVREALALRWGDIDFGARRVTIQRCLYRGEFGPPKTKYGRRTIRVTVGSCLAGRRKRLDHAKTKTDRDRPRRVFPR